MIEKVLKSNTFIDRSRRGYMARSNDGSSSVKSKLGLFQNPRITKRQSRIMGAIALAWMGGVYVVLQCVAHPAWFQFGH